MDEKQTTIVQNALILYIAPELIMFNALFSDMENAMKLIFEEFTEALTSEKVNIPITPETTSFINEISSEIYRQLPSAIEDHPDIAEQILNNGQLQKSIDIAEKIKIKFPSLWPLDKQIKNIEILKYVAILKSNESPAELLKEFMDCATPYIERDKQEQLEEQKQRARIFELASSDDFLALSEYLESADDLNIENDKRQTPLMLAVEKQNLTTISLLLDANADPCRQNFFNDSAISLAVQNNNAVILELLLSFANDSCVDIDWEHLANKYIDNKHLDIIPTVLSKLPEIPQTLIERTIENGWSEMLEVLLDNGLSPDHSPNSESLIFKVLGKEKFELADILLNAGADINAIDFFERSPLFKAIEENNQTCIDFLINHDAKILSRWVHATYDVLYKYAENHSVTFKSTIEKFKDQIDNLDELARVVLLRSIDDEEPELLDCTETLGIDVNQLFEENKTIPTNNLPLLSKLIEHGLDINAKYPDREPLIYNFIAYGENNSVIDFLIENNIDLDIKNRNGDHILFTALLHKPHLVKTMLAQGVDPDIKNRNGYSAVELYIQKPEIFSSVIDNFIDAGADFTGESKSGYPVFHILAAYYDADTVKKIFDKDKIDINQANSNGHTALIHALYSQNIEVIKLLVQLGADVNASVNAKISPLSLALFQSNQELITALTEENTSESNINKFDSASFVELA